MTSFKWLPIFGLILVGAQCRTLGKKMYIFQYVYNLIVFMFLLLSNCKPSTELHKDKAAYNIIILKQKVILI